MTWNKRNDQFAMSCGLTAPSVLLLMRWILRRAKQNQVDEIEIDLRIFNAWIAKNRGRPFDRKTIREAIATIDQNSQGLILITKSYSPWVKKVLVRPLAFVLQINSPLKEETPKLPTGNPMFSDAYKKQELEQQQQDISKLKTMFDNLGLKYAEDTIIKLWRKAGKKVDDVKLAVEMMLHAHSTQTEPVRVPEAWLIRCIERKFYEGFSLYYQAELPRFTSSYEIEQFVKGLMPSPT
ncbi:MAG: hypothetical protein HC930_01300 [Hydrococcus sp. SU_1_0]|nr:hypothetical protein [Hydrococcus sp. SU_1_0]